MARSRGGGSTTTRVSHPCPWTAYAREQRADRLPSGAHAASALGRSPGASSLASVSPSRRDMNPPLSALASPPRFVGQFRTDPDARAVYAEAAGIQRIMPLAVAVPVSADDVVALVRWAADTRTVL